MVGRAQMGGRGVERGQLSANTGQGGRSSFGLHEQRTTELAVMPAEMQLLQPLSGYLCITGHHRSFVRFPYLAPQVRQEGFVPRAILPAPIAPARRAPVIPPRPPAADGRRKRV